MDREKLNTKISELVDVLRTEEDRRISMSDIASITEVLITTMSRYFASIDTSMYREFQDLSDHITTMRTEIARAQPKEIKAKKIPRAGKELDAVVRATEDATNTIMESVETIMGADPTDIEAYTRQVNDQCMRIFEACSFQDITGQRVTKVINTLTFIEERIGSILTAWPEGEDLEDEAPAEPEAAAAPGDKELLNGPALEGEGISQNDVDSMFSGEGAPAAAEAASEPAPETAPEPEPAKTEKPAPAENAKAQDAAPAAAEAASEPAPETAPKPAKTKKLAPAKNAKAQNAAPAAAENASEPAPETTPEPEPAKTEKPAPAENAKAQDAAPAEAARPAVEDAGETETEAVKAVAKAVGETKPAKSGDAAAERASSATKGNGDAKPKPAATAKPKPAAAPKGNGAAAKPKPAAAPKGNGAAAKPKPAAADKSGDEDDDDDDGPSSNQDDIDALFD